MTKFTLWQLLVFNDRIKILLEWIYCFTAVGNKLLQISMMPYVGICHCWYNQCYLCLNVIMCTISSKGCLLPLMQSVMLFLAVYAINRCNLTSLRQVSNEQVALDRLLWAPSSFVWFSSLAEMVLIGLMVYGMYWSLTECYAVGRAWMENNIFV